MSKTVSPRELAAGLTEFWSPQIVGEVDDAYVKVAKIKGNFTWHSHDTQDEMFFVLKGHMRIELEHETIELDEGDMFIVPNGVMHNPSAEEECHILLIERKSTLHTGDKVVEQTRSIDEQRGKH